MPTHNEKWRHFCRGYVTVEIRFTCDEEVIKLHCTAKDGRKVTLADLSCKTHWQDPTIKKNGMTGGDCPWGNERKRKSCLSISNPTNDFVGLWTENTGNLSVSIQIYIHTSKHIPQTKPAKTQNILNDIKYTQQ